MRCNWISKQSAIALASSDGRDLRPEAPCIAVGALGPSLVRRNFARGHIAWGDLSITYFCLPPFKCLLRVIRLIAFETQFTAALHAGSLVSCHNFRSLCLCLNNRSKPGRSLLRSRSVILLVDSLYAEAIEAENSRAALSASTPDLISILGDINSEARFWNRS
jgi:hypothetical protein